MIKYAAMAFMHYSMRVLLIAGLVVGMVAQPTYAMESAIDPGEITEESIENTETTPVDDGVVLLDEEEVTVDPPVDVPTAVVVDEPEVVMPEVVAAESVAMMSVESDSVSAADASQGSVEKGEDGDSTEDEDLLPLRITEVLVQTRATDMEYVELYNPNKVESIDLDDMRLLYSRDGSASTRVDKKEMIEFKDFKIESEQAVLVARKIQPETLTGLVVFDTLTPSINDFIVSNGEVELVAQGDFVVDSIAWGDREGSLIEKVSGGVSIQRCITNTGTIEGDVYSDLKNPTSPGEVLSCLSDDSGDSGPGGGNEDSDPAEPVNQCTGLRLTEIGANLTDQFIEVQNTSSSSLDVTGCRVMTNRSTTKYHSLPTQTLAAGEYLSIAIADTPLTLTKTTKGTVYLLDSAGEAELDERSYENLSKETTWALIDDEWRQTYALTPGVANEYQQYVACELGYERNEDTGRCRKIPVDTRVECKAGQYRSEETGRCRNIPVESVLVACKAGQYRHPETNRCRNLTSATSSLTPCKAGQYRNSETNRCRNNATAGSTLTPCKAGQERNPATNRCRSTAAANSTLKPCAPGQERNPATNRCRKIVSGDATAGFAVVEDPTAEAGKKWSWVALGGVGAVSLGYGVWEWRRELKDMFANLLGKLPFVK